MLLGWEVHPSARLGHSVIVADKVQLGADVQIASGTMIKGLAQLSLGDGAVIGPFNWISGAPLSSGRFVHSPHRFPALRMAKYSGIMARHLVDCSDTVTLDEYAVLAGSRSTVLTHSANLVRDRQTTAAVHVGARSAVMGGCMLLSGIKVPPRCIVSAGSVVTTPLTKELTFYRGNPAIEVRSLPADLAYFHRDHAWSATD